MKKYVYGFVICICVAYLISMLAGFFSSATDTDFVVNGSLKSYTTYDALVVRSEKIVSNSGNGKFAPAMNEGEKTAKGEIVAFSYDKSSEQLYQKKIKAENRFIKGIKTVLNKDDISNYEVKQLDKAIEEKMDSYSEATRTGEYGEAISAGRDIDDIVEKRLEELSRSLPRDTYLYTLKKRMDRSNRLFERSTGAIRSSVAGMVSYSIDHYEDAASYKNVAKMSDKKIESLLDRIVHRKSGRANNSVESACMKIIDEFDYFFVFVVDKQESKGLIPGVKREITVNDIPLSFNAMVYTVKKSGTKNIITLRANSYLAETLPFRKVSLSIADADYSVSGLKVGKNSLFDFSEDGKTAKIMLSRSNYAVERSVNILEADDLHAIVKDVNELSDEQKGSSDEKDPDVIKEFDEYIIDPAGFSDGQYVE